MVSPPPDVGSNAGPIAAPAPNRTSAPSTDSGAAPAGAPATVDRADIRPLDLQGALQILIAEVRTSLIDTLTAQLTPAARFSEASSLLPLPTSPGDLVGGTVPAIAVPDSVIETLVSDLSTAADTTVPPPQPALAPSPETPVASTAQSLAQARASLIETLLADLQTGGGPGAAPQQRMAAISESTAASAELLAVAAAQDLEGAVPAARAIVDLALRSLPQEFEPDVWQVLLPRMDEAVQAGAQRAIDAVSIWRDVPATVIEAARESGSLAMALLAEEPVYPWPPPEWLVIAPRLARLWRRRRVLKRRLADPDFASKSNWDEVEEPKP